eukprot:scaffold28532_cov78-Skeletonema_dohrnii-CCMP3373.AAC.1
MPRSKLFLFYDEIPTQLEVVTGDFKKQKASGVFRWSLFMFMCYFTQAFYLQEHPAILTYVADLSLAISTDSRTENSS